jgi:hypothetical protein
VTKILTPADIAWQAFQQGALSELAKTNAERIAIMRASGLDADSNEVEKLRAEFNAWWQRHVIGHGHNDWTCEKCGHDPYAIVEYRWTMFVEKDPPSLNAHLHNKGPQAYLYRRARTEWGWLFRAARLRNNVPKARRRRRATFTRLYAGRQQERDYDNLAGGMKLIVDAMVLEGLLVDDSPKHADLFYAQERVPDGGCGLRVELEELA